MITFENHIINIQVEASRYIDMVIAKDEQHGEVEMISEDGCSASYRFKTKEGYNAKRIADGKA